MLEFTMILLPEVLWAQLTLVALGAALQLIAFCAFARDPHVHGGIQPDLPDRDETEAHEEKTALPTEPPPVKAYYPRMNHTPDDAFSDLHPGQLLKTKKVAFKQRFEGLR
jgi:hypothetical protein